MTVKELNISEFGCIKDKKLVFGDRMNIICGDNESGKSTVLLFIKFMLYGLGRGKNTDKERSLSWSGHTAAGSMTFSHGGRCYRIERRIVGKQENRRVFCLDSGEDISTDSPGEYFLGVPKEVFESSACVGQMLVSNIDGEKTSASIQNLLTGADENVDIKKAQDKLDDLRKKYCLKKGDGGVLFEEEQMIEKLKLSLKNTIKASEELDTKKASLNKARDNLTIAKNELEAKDKMLSELNNVAIIKRFDECRRKEAERAETIRQRDGYLKSKLLTEFFPNTDHITRLTVAKEALADAETAYSVKKNEAERIRNTQDFDEILSALGEKAEQNGGRDAVCSQFDKLKKAERQKKKAIAILFSVFAVLAACCVASFFFIGLMSLFFLIPTPAVAVMLAVLFSKKKKIHRERTALAEQYGAKDNGFSEKIALCCENLKKKKQFYESISNTEFELKRSEENAREHRTTLGGLLYKTLPVGSVSVNCLNAENEISRLNDILDIYDGYIQKEKSLSAVIISEREALGAYDEDKLRNEITVNVEDVTSEAVLEAQRQSKFTKGRISALESKIETLNNDVITLQATFADPVKIADDLAAIEKQHKHDSESYAAVRLAIDALTDAGKGLRSEVIPSIAKNAGEFLSKISAGKYENVTATGEKLSLTVDDNGYGIASDILSGGTRDAVYLSLRIALFMRIFGTELPPLILDEALCQLDAKRTERILRLLHGLTDGDGGIQCILFTSQGRECEIFENSGFEYNKFTL